MKKILKLLFCLLIIFVTLNGTSYSKAKQNKYWTVDSPVKAVVLYFPSPAVMRCLNNAGIPREFHKASIYRRAKFPNEEIEESVLVGVKKDKKSYRGFSFVGTVKTKSEIIPIMINGEIAFGAQNQKFQLGFFGLEKLLGLQGKVHIKDKIGNQQVKYETFLKSTKGKIGDQNYKLELTGEDQIINHKPTYVLSGSGMLGNDDLSVIGKSTKQNNYEIFEKYGTVEVFTVVSIYD